MSNWSNQTEGWVYFVRYLDLIKIGVAQDPWKRFHAIKGSSPVPVEFIGAMPGGPPLERELHARWRHRRHHNEWFYASQEMTAFVEANAIPVEAVPARPDRRFRENKGSPKIGYGKYIGWDPIGTNATPEAPLAECGFSGRC
jgi:hypothetical protein